MAIQLVSLFHAHRGSPEGMARVADSTDPRNLDGFDGQYFLALAKDPLLLHGAESALDSPGIRARRIGLPALAWLLAPLVGGAGPALLVAEALAACCLVAVAAAGLRVAGESPAWCAAIGLLLPFVLSIELVTAELLAAALVLAAAHAAESGRRPAFVLLLGSACLAKEAAVLAAIAFGLAALLRRRVTEAALAFSSVLPLAAWQAYLSFRLPAVRSDAGVVGLLENLGIPGKGLLQGLLTPLDGLLSGQAQLRQVGILAAVSWMAAGAALAVVLLATGRTAGRLLGGAGAFLALTLSYGGAAHAYDGVFNFGRQLFLLPCGLLVVFFHEGKAVTGAQRTLLRAWLAFGGFLGLSWWVVKALVSPPAA